MKYKLTAIISISVSTEVEANTAEEAIKISEDRSNMALPSNNCYPENEYWVADELDGSPYNIRVEEA